jgi:VanZ family protein
MVYKRKKVLAWILVLVWMTIIFYFSSQPGEKSSEISSGFVEVVVEIAEKVVPNTAPNLDYNNLHLHIRKQGHFFMYFVLGILTINALTKMGVKGKRIIWISLLICVAYAITDEIHQLFVPGRSGEVRDVLIDSIGASIGIIFYRYIKF